MTVRGQLRRSTANRFCVKVDKVLDEAPERVVIDLTDATLDDDGVRALRQVKSAAEGCEVQLVLTSRDRDSLAAIAAADRFTVA